MENFITWEQAVKYNSQKEVGIEYAEALKETLQVFSKDTLFQFSNMELYMEGIELIQPYQEKDYSKFLFKKTEEFIDKVKKIQDSKIQKEINKILIKAIDRAKEKINSK